LHNRIALRGWRRRFRPGLGQTLPHALVGGVVAEVHLHEVVHGLDAGVAAAQEVPVHRGAGPRVGEQRRRRGLLVGGGLDPVQAGRREVAPRRVARVQVVRQRPRRQELGARRVARPHGKGAHSAFLLVQHFSQPEKTKCPYQHHGRGCKFRLVTLKAINPRRQNEDGKLKSI